MWRLLLTNVTLKDVEHIFVCVSREESGLFWAVSDDLILLFMYSPPHERELRSQVVSVLFSLTHFLSLSCKHAHHTHTSIFIQLFGTIFGNTRHHFQDFWYFIWSTHFLSLCQNWVDEVSSSVTWHAYVYVYVHFILFACLMTAPAGFVTFIHLSDW